jgi:gamma-tubulin complex component 2
LTDFNLHSDPVAKKLYAHLLEKASIPYFSILRTWIHEGEINDPYDEFMVQERKGVNKDQLKQDFNDMYWEQRYTLRRDGIPDFLAPFSEKVLLAGKYLNVLRECGMDVPALEDRIVRQDAAVDESVAAFGDAVRLLEGGRLVDVFFAF